MPSSLFVTATPVVPVEHPSDGDDGLPRAEEAVAHAVAKPVVDGLESSVCGLLVTATAARDWLSVGEGTRCEECARIAG
jgi:hypothetical protein